jgi:hypothetical protein
MAAFASYVLAGVVGFVLGAACMLLFLYQVAVRMNPRRVDVQKIGIVETVVTKTEREP